MAIESKIRRPLISPEREEQGAVNRPPKSRLVWKIISILLVLSVIIGGFIFLKRYFSADGSGLVADLANESAGSDAYSAVFLDNGQVYFGILERTNKEFYRLTGVYYLQSGATTDSSNISLVRLGNEAHGPTDEMIINKDHVLFFEEMRPDSKVMQAIADDKAK